MMTTAQSQFRSEDGGAMKKGLRSRIRTLRCPQFEPEQEICQDRRFLQRCYVEGFDSAVWLILEYMDKYTPLPELLFSHVEELRAKRIADIHGDGQPGTVLCNAGFILACSKILKLVYELHGDEIEWSRAIERVEDTETI